jgi:hypothetical protein
MRQLVNRADAWGGYYQDQTPDGSLTTKQTTRPHPRDRGKIRLNKQILKNHAAATETRFVVGLHTTSPTNTSRWAAIDIDHHGPTSTAAAVNFAAALNFFEQLHRLRFRPVLVDSNGAGGFHIWVIFSEPIPTPTAFRFVRWVIRDHAAHGMPTPPEVFPKQVKIDTGKFGNWLRLPGRHHTRPHWSRVWDGTTWLEGAACVEQLLHHDGDDPSLIPGDVLAPEINVTIRTPAPRRTISTGTDKLSARIRAYISKLPGGLGEGQHRDDFGYTLAAFLVRDLGLTDADALPWLEEWDSHNAVPKGRERLIKLIASAHSYGKHAYGSGRAERPSNHPVMHIRTEVEL